MAPVAQLVDLVNPHESPPDPVFPLAVSWAVHVCPKDMLDPLFDSLSSWIKILRADGTQYGWELRPGDLLVLREAS